MKESALDLTAAQMYRPDLLAKELIITAVYAERMVYVSALIENIGVGSATGPFNVAISVDLTRGGILTSYVQVFQVPASVRLAGRPVFEQALARTPIGISSPFFPTQYVTERMEVPLYYRDEDPSAYYNAEFLADSDNQVSESNESNNYYAWPGRFWFMSPGGEARKAPVVIERSLLAH